MFKNLFRKKKIDTIKQISETTNYIDVFTNIVKSSKNQSKLTDTYKDGNNALAKSNEENYFHKVDTVFSCIDYIAKAASQAVPRIYIKDPNSSVRTPVTDKALLQWIDAPTPFHTWGETIELLIQGLQLSGTSYLTFEKVKGRYESWFLTQPSTVKIVPGKDYIQGVIWNDSITYAANQIIVFRNATLNNAYYGVPSVRPLLDPLLLESSSIEELKTFYEGSTLLSGVLESEFALSNEQVAMLREQFRELFGKKGVERGGTAVLQNKLKYKPIKATPADAKLLESLNLTDERVFKVFKLNPVAVGGETNIPANVKELMRVTFNTAVRPYLYKIADQITIFLKKVTKNQNIVFEFDFDRVVELETSLDTKSQAAKTLFVTGVASLNESRDLVGLPKIDKEEADMNILSASIYGRSATYLQTGESLNIDNQATNNIPGSTDPDGGNPDLTYQ